eukprot:4497207-Pleurochrysis_carterae.AAC.2
MDQLLQLWLAAKVALFQTSSVLTSANLLNRRWGSAVECSQYIIVVLERVNIDIYIMTNCCICSQYCTPVHNYCVLANRSRATKRLEARRVRNIRGRGIPTHTTTVCGVVAGFCGGQAVCSSNWMLRSQSHDYACTRLEVLNIL